VEQVAIDQPINAKRVESESKESRATRSFTNTIARNGRNAFGFSLGISQAHISDSLPNSLKSSPADLTAYSASIFANLGRRKSSLHFDYSGGYRNYYGQHNMNGADHYGNIIYSYRTNRNVSFQLSDVVSSSLNDPFSSFSSSLQATADWNPSPSQEIAFVSQRLTKNKAAGQIGLEATRSTHLYILGSYDNYWYSLQENQNLSAVQVGAGLNQRITSWLFLTTSYSTYLNSVNQRMQDQQIHRLEVGRFRFMISRNFEIFASGGFEAAKNEGKYKVQGMFRSGISRSSAKNVIYANYQRTMVSALGYSRILPSNVVTLGMGQRLTVRSSFKLDGSYTRSSDFNYDGLFNGSNVRAQYEYALSSYLFASVNYTYQYQKNSIMVLANIPHFDRSVVFIHLSFALPSIRLTSE
jgi:hypothetical protein